MAEPTSDSERSPAVIEAQWQGPLPPPEVLARFDKVIPGGAERIFRMAEIEQQHRIAQESTMLNAAIRSAKRGQILGTIIALSALCGALLNTYLGGHAVVSVALVGVPVASIVIALVRGRK
jgi:uncharacterized membrane protein